MMRILGAEWLRFRCGHANLLIVAGYAAVLLVCALWAVHGAQQYRQAYAAEYAARDALIRAAQATPPAAGAPASPKAAAMQAYALARSRAGLAQLPPLPGLVLSLSRYDVLDTRIAVSVDSRYADGRRSDALSSPVLAQMGALDLAAMVVLVLPLAAIGLCAGAVQEDRERGVWRTVRAQATHLWQPFYAALAIRATVLIAPPVVACTLALLLDAGWAAWPVAAWWSLCLVAYTCFWVALCGVIALLPISCGAAVLATLSVWLLLTFGFPAALDASAAARHPMPSRLAAIVQLRAAQQEAETRMNALLDAWYAGHPDWRPLHLGSHAWPVTFLPRFEYQDARVRSLMLQFDLQRLAQDQYRAKRAWVAAPLAMLQIADELAGISPARYWAYMNQVERHERAWRAFFVPRIMSYQGLSDQDFKSIPRFAAVAPAPVDAVRALAGQLLLAASALGLLLQLMWRWSARRL